LKDEHLSLFVMLGQSAQNVVSKLPDTVPPQHLMLSPTEDLALVLPDDVRRATRAAETYRLFFVFENYFRDLVLETLTDRERQVLEQRFGLIDGYSRTLEEVGRQFQVTRERIRQIEAKALRKMRHPTRIRQLEGFLEAPGI